jgi:hypothetical protein
VTRSPGSASERKECIDQMFVITMFYSTGDVLPRMGTPEAVGGAASTRIRSNSRRLPKMVRPKGVHTWRVSFSY